MRRSSRRSRMRRPRHPRRSNGCIRRHTEGVPRGDLEGYRSLRDRVRHSRYASSHLVRGCGGSGGKEGQDGNPASPPLDPGGSRNVLGGALHAGPAREDRDVPCSEVPGNGVLGSRDPQDMAAHRKKYIAPRGDKVSSFPTCGSIILHACFSDEPCKENACPGPFDRGERKGKKREEKDGDPEK